LTISRARWALTPPAIRRQGGETSRMRWYWIDRYTEFVHGQRATAIKNVSLAEDHLHDHFPGYPVMPNSLVVEGMAQTAGLLVGEFFGFEKRVVLGKVSRATFHFLAQPGDTLVYRVTIQDIKDDGALATATSHVGDRLQAEAEISFAHLDSRFAEPLFDPPDFLNWLRLVRLYEVGRTADGAPLEQAPAQKPYDDPGH
jgi:3-hydroxyacyl-[acyl-carrier-protein] dehydratase